MSLKIQSTIEYGKGGIKLSNLATFYQGLVQNKVSVGLQRGTKQEVLLRAVKNEYGYQKGRIKIGKKTHSFDTNVPPRPFVRLYIYQDKKKNISNNYVIGIEHAYAEMNGQQRGGKRFAHNVLSYVGRMTELDMKNIILIYDRLQANAPYTVKKKGFDHPLLETGEMVGKIKYKVSKNGSKN